MTAVARKHDPNVTVGGDERMSERSSKTARVLPIRPDLTADSRAHARYHGEGSSGNKNTASKIRNFVSLHVVEAKQAPELAWLTQQRPDTIASIATSLIPTKAQAGNPLARAVKVAARLFKLAVHCTAYAACAATATDKRAAVSASLVALCLAIAIAAHQLGA